MKSHVFLTLSAGLTQVLAAPYIERPTRELTGHETVTSTASGEFHVDGLPGLPKPVFSTHTHHAHGTETAAVTVPTGGYGASTTATESDSVTESIVTEVETDTKTVTIAASADAITASGFTNSSVAVPKTTITVTPVFVTVSANHTSHSSTHGETPSFAARPRGLQAEQVAPEKQYTTLTFTFDTMATTYTLLLPNGADATDTPAPVIRPTRSYPLAPPSGTWTEWNSMVTSTLPVVQRRSAPSSPVSPVETSVSIAPGYHVLPIPAPAPNPLEEAALSVTTPAPSLLLPKEQVRTTILNGGEGAVERISKVGKGVQAKHIEHEGVHAGKQNDANDEPTSHDLSWYFTASYTDDSITLTMQPCYYDWQCWPEPSSSNTETFLPGVDGGKMAAATQV
ncbi:hypothetical protein B0H65DRAFT_213382 [Neurospora tetraspora]|uniref:Uncharacterized protein n=1 Tax=Neurospora tetraspora TaxID=94610 RepID=A0AAE0JG98_9PEZI|nr:hypothetical protein B0H65DRAFT_213382 [Neurospora tetraspora]